MSIDKELVRGITNVEATYNDLLNQTPSKRDGRHLTYFCPHHQDVKNPNLKVTVSDGPHRGSYRCYACAESGDIFTLWMKVRGVDFKEALTALAERAGLPVNDRPREQPKTTKKGDVACDLNHDYETWPDDLKDWIAGRGITPESIRRFNLDHAVYQGRYHALAIPYGDPQQDGYVKLRFYKGDYSHKFTTWPSGRSQRLFGLPVKGDIASYCAKVNWTQYGSLKRGQGPASFRSLTVPRRLRTGGQTSFKASTWPSFMTETKPVEMAQRKPQ